MKRAKLLQHYNTTLKCVVSNIEHLSTNKKEQYLNLCLRAETTPVEIFNSLNEFEFRLVVGIACRLLIEGF